MSREFLVTIPCNNDQSVRSIVNVAAIESIADVRTIITVLDVCRDRYVSSVRDDAIDAVIERAVTLNLDRNELLQLVGYAPYIHAWATVHKFNGLSIVEAGKIEAAWYESTRPIFVDTYTECEPDYTPELKNELSNILSNYRRGLLDELCTCQSICDVIMNATAFHGVSLDDAWRLAVNKFGATNIHSNSILRCLHTYADCHVFDDVACFVGYSED